MKYMYVYPREQWLSRRFPRNAARTRYPHTTRPPARIAQIEDMDGHRLTIGQPL
jgi:hypothetical protein